MESGSSEKVLQWHKQQPRACFQTMLFLVTMLQTSIIITICRKIFEILIFNSLQQFLEEHKLLLIHRSGFRSSDSCFNQLLFVVDTLYKAFDAYPTLDAREVFLDICKAFDNVWHEGLIYKLKSMGLSHSLLNLTQSFLQKNFKEPYSMVRRPDRFLKKQVYHRGLFLVHFFSNIRKRFVREHRNNCKTLC